MLNHEDYQLLLECYETVDAFTRKPTTSRELSPAEFSALIVMLDILKPELKELH